MLSKTPQSLEGKGSCHSESQALVFLFCFIPLLYFICEHVRVHVLTRFMFLGVPAYALALAQVWGSGVDLSCHSLPRNQLSCFLETGSLTFPGTRWFGLTSGRWAPGVLLPLTSECHHICLFTWQLGIKLKFLSLYGKHFMHWAISPILSSALKKNKNKKNPNSIYTLKTSSIFCFPTKANKMVQAEFYQDIGTPMEEYRHYFLYTSSGLPSIPSQV